MDHVRRYLTYAALIALAFGLYWAVNHFLSRVTVPTDYTDMEGMEQFKSYPLDRTLKFHEYRPRDKVCFALGTQDDKRINFGWIAGLPGDEIAVSGHHLMVNGKDFDQPYGDLQQLPDCRGLRVPANHVFVISSNHEFDSIANGPIPALALRGRIGEGL